MKPHQQCWSTDYVGKRSLNKCMSDIPFYSHSPTLQLICGSTDFLIRLQKFSWQTSLRLQALIIGDVTLKCLSQSVSSKSCTVAWSVVVTPQRMRGCRIWHAIKLSPPRVHAWRRTCTVSPRPTSSAPACPPASSSLHRTADSLWS